MFVSRCHYFLQQPRDCDRNVEYCNPHCLSMESAKPLFTYDLKDSDELDTFHADRLYLNTNPIDAFVDTSTCIMLPETETPTALRTQLYKHQKQALTFMIRREAGWVIDESRQDIWRSSKDATGRRRYRNAPFIRITDSTLTVRQIHKWCDRTYSEQTADRILWWSAHRCAWAWKNA